MNRRIVVLHGVNLGLLGERDPGHYGSLRLSELEFKIGQWAKELGLDASFGQTNHEGEYCEELHNARSGAQGLILNPGAWTHYSWAIRDALEIADLPAVEVHLSAVENREDWRKVSVIRDLCIGTVSGKGPDGYLEALKLLATELEGTPQS